VVPAGTFHESILAPALSSLPDAGCLVRVAFVRSYNWTCYELYAASSPCPGPLVACRHSNVYPYRALKISQRYIVTRSRSRILPFRKAEKRGDPHHLQRILTEGSFSVPSALAPDPNTQYHIVSQCLPKCKRSGSTVLEIYD
jgi:hypothetical protein